MGLQMLKTAMEEHGIQPVDFPAAFVIHELLAVAFLATTWAICYQTQPSQSALLQPLARAIETSNNRWIAGARVGFANGVASAERKIAASPRLSAMNWDTTRLTTALAESTIFRKSIKPISIPAKLWGTWKIMELLPWRRTGAADPEQSTERSANHGTVREGSARKAKRARQRQASVRGKRAAVAAATVCVPTLGTSR